MAVREKRRTIAEPATTSRRAFDAPTRLGNSAPQLRLHPRPGRLLDAGRFSQGHVRRLERGIGS
jgi:hypothetical protein